MALLDSEIHGSLISELLALIKLSYVVLSYLALIELSFVALDELSYWALTQLSFVALSDFELLGSFGLSCMALWLSIIRAPCFC